jgi:hypothetical protein
LCQAAKVADNGKKRLTARPLCDATKIELAKAVAKVSVYDMNAAVANGRIPDVQSRAHEITVKQAEVWFEWMDEVLDIHRRNFVFRQATPAELAQHKTALELAIRTSLWMKALIEDPKFNEADLASRLDVRIQQLKDAYSTFHDSELSEARAEEILKRVFPE